MKTKIIKMGRSYGIRIPKPVLDALDFQNKVELRICDDAIVIRPVKHPRAGWAKAFARMSQNQDDKLLDADSLVPTHWDLSEWKW